VPPKQTRGDSPASGNALAPVEKHLPFAGSTQPPPSQPVAQGICCGSPQATQLLTELQTEVLEQSAPMLTHCPKPVVLEQQPLEQPLWQQGAPMAPQGTQAAPLQPSAADVHVPPGQHTWPLAPQAAQPASLAQKLPVPQVAPKAWQEPEPQQPPLQEPPSQQLCPAPPQPAHCPALPQTSPWEHCSPVATHTRSRVSQHPEVQMPPPAAPGQQGCPAWPQPSQ
jgi:hypothetical protein